MAENSVLEDFIKMLGKLPGLGPRSARRAVLHLVKHRESLMLPLIQSFQHVADTIVICEQCGNLDSGSPCHICSDEKRDSSLLCVVEEVADLWAIERSKTFKGYYHVLGGTLSAIDGRGPDSLNISSLVSKTVNDNLKEIILATNATVEGQTTAHYLTERLKDNNVKISRLAHGIPVGGELDYLDDGTLGMALKARLPF